MARSKQIAFDVGQETVDINSTENVLKDCSLELQCKCDTDKCECKKIGTCNMVGIN